MSIDDDLVVVPAKQDNFEKMFLNGFWSAIEISANRREHLRYIACYRVAPESKIVAYATIKRIEPSQTDPDKSVVFFSKPKLLSKPIPMGKRQFGQGRRYANFARMLKSESLDDLFDFGDTTQAMSKDESSTPFHWTQEKTEQYLMQLASQGILQVSYSELYKLAGVNRRDAASRNAFNTLLGDISIQQHAKGLPLLSVLVVGKSTQRPGFGFFTVARAQNPAYADLDTETIYSQELENVRRHTEIYARLLQPIHRATYLLIWNPLKYAWKEFQEDWGAFKLGQRPIHRWSCGNRKNIKVGDRVFLMRLGKQEKTKGIIASGYVTKSGYESPHWGKGKENDTALYIDFEPDALLNPLINELLDPRQVSADFNWFPQQSGTNIPNEVAVALEQTWRTYIREVAPFETPDSAITEELRTYSEGAKKQVFGYRYERDAWVRQACVDHYGTCCAVCDFNFADDFGEIGAGYIHVHHLKPISSFDGEHSVDPIDDLRPVCPNCHSMLHRSNPPYSIDELKAIRAKQLKLKSSG